MTKVCLSRFIICFIIVCMLSLVTASGGAGDCRGAAPLNVSFIDISLLDNFSDSWIFGDRGASNLENPSHTYFQPGNYSVALTIWKPGTSSKPLGNTTVKSMFIPVSCGSEPPSNKGIEEEVMSFKAAAANLGYVVQDGFTVASNLNDLYCQGSMWAPLYPNPNSQYISAVLPKVPGQAECVASNGSFRIREDEAVVVIGETPPQMAYFSFNFHMLRGSLLTEIGPPILWIPVADPVSSLGLQKTGSTPFNQPFAVVGTGHGKTRDDVHRMLATAGLGSVTNDQIISPSLFKLGLDQDSDEYIFALRTAVPENKGEFDNYTAELRKNVRILRVRPKSASEDDQTKPVLAADPLPVPHQRVAGTGTSELDLNPTLELLRQRIVDAYPGYTATDIPVDDWFDEPYPGLQGNKVTDLPQYDGVAGATTDATYLASGNFPLPDGSFLIAYGPHHRATGKATYSSVSVYADAKLGAGLVTVQSPDLQGSARDYINDQSNADMFYAWTFTRSGTPADHTTQLQTGNFCEDPGCPVDLYTLRVGYRAYAEPATQTHPAKSELLYDRLLMFTPK